MNWSTLGRPGSTEPAGWHGRRLVFVALMVLGMALLLLVGYTYADKTVTIMVDGEEQQVKTYASTVADVLREHDITLEPEDQLEPQLSFRLKDGQTITVQRAVPVTLLADGEVREIKTLAGTVSDLLVEQEVELGNEDLVLPEVATTVTGDMTIKVVRVQTAMEEKEVAIPFNSRRNNTPSLNKGETRVAQVGKNGMEIQKWQVAYHDGQEVGRDLITKETIVAPVDQVVQVGTLQTISRGGQELRYTRTLDVTATAYTYTGRNTASGVPPRVGGVAVDTSVIPMHTRMYVEGYGYAVALDRGGAIKGNKIDVFLETSSEARRWGVKRVKVYVLE